MSIQTTSTADLLSILRSTKKGESKTGDILRETAANELNQRDSERRRETDGPHDKGLGKINHHFI